MSGYARMNLITEADDFKKNRLAKLGKSSERTLKTIAKDPKHLAKTIKMRGNKRNPEWTMP